MSPRLDQLKQLLTESPNDSFLLFAIAKEYEGLRAYEDAFSYYRRLINNDPAYVGAYYHLAKLYETTEQPDKALEIYAAGISIARQADDLHALAELSAAKLNLELGEN